MALAQLPPSFANNLNGRFSAELQGGARVIEELVTSASRKASRKAGLKYNNKRMKVHSHSGAAVQCIACVCVRVCACVRVFIVAVEGWEVHQHGMLQHVCDTHAHAGPVCLVGTLRVR